MLHAGAAVRDITPASPVALFGYPHVERISTGVHDPLLASVLVLRDDGRTVVLASLDLLMLQPPVAVDWRRAVAQAVGCEEAGVFISCTHTHSGPVTSRVIAWSADPAIPRPDPAYLASVKHELLAAARAAGETTIPAELAWTASDARGVGGNRLSRDGVTDPECGILAVRARDDRAILAAAIVYGMHPTVLHEDSALVSSDFPHFARRQIAECVGRGVPVLYHTGPAGNQSPRHWVQGQTFAEAERLGRKLGRSVCNALHRLTPANWHGQAVLSGRVAQTRLPRNPVRPLAEAQRMLADCRNHYERLQRTSAPKAEVRTAECAIFGAEGAVALASDAEGDLADALDRDYGTVDVQVVRIGDACLVGLPGECFAEYGMEIKRRSRRRAFVVSLVNGELQGYIVTPQAAKAGGYEAANAVFSPAAGEVLVNAALSLID